MLPLDLPPVRVHHPHVEARPDLLAGSPVVRGSRVPVRRLWLWHRKGVTVETLVRRYPSLGPARVLSALSFAYDNQETVAADVRRELALLEANDHLGEDHERADIVELGRAPAPRGGRTLALTEKAESFFASAEAERAARVEHGDGEEPADPVDLFCAKCGRVVPSSEATVWRRGHVEGDRRTVRKFKHLPCGTVLAERVPHTGGARPAPEPTFSGRARDAASDRSDADELGGPPRPL